MRASLNFFDEGVTPHFDQKEQAVGLVAGGPPGLVLANATGVHRDSRVFRTSR